MTPIGKKTNQTEFGCSGVRGRIKYYSRKLIYVIHDAGVSPYTAIDRDSYAACQLIRLSAAAAVAALFQS